jgi:large subunit ribosomal protein L21
MYAVIETGGKQYRVELGTELAVERLDVAPGSTINIDRVLLVADGDSAQVGTPTVADALVTADVLRQDRGDKLIVFKYRPKARHRAKKGHRQEQTVLRVADIRLGDRSAADEAGKARAGSDEAREQARAEAERKAAADQALAAKLAAESQPTTVDAAEAKPGTKPAARRRTAATGTAAAPSDTARVTHEPSETTERTPQAKATNPKTSRSRTTRSSSKKDE